jgi:hypothetical protein
METTMKTTLLAVAALGVAVAFSAPASAQEDEGAMAAPAAQAQPRAAQPRAARARAQQPPGISTHSTSPEHDVYDSVGNYVGSDPDPLVRLELARDPPDWQD